MIRQFIKLDNLQIYDEFHMQDGDSFKVNVALDGNTTEYHVEGIKIIKDVLEKGVKILPILVYESGERYYLLDGFKRCIAHKELDSTLIEAFVCTFQEYKEKAAIPLGNKVMVAYKGGQNYEVFGLYEGNAGKEDEILYWNGDVEGLRIEFAENIQIHWSSYGRYRLSLGDKEFIQLAEAISKI